MPLTFQARPTSTPVIYEQAFSMQELFHMLNIILAWDGLL